MRVWLALSVLAVAACASEGEPSARRDLAAARTGAAERSEAASDETHETLPHLSCEGLAVRALEDGRVSVEGIDRWGAPLSITYVDAYRFLGAIPVLSRSLTPDQAAARRAFDEELRRRGGS
ncbi:MAG TPA: hypothetical protein VIL20_31575 [Sandaracinaceae bacterium]